MIKSLPLRLQEVINAVNQKEPVNYDPRKADSKYWTRDRIQIFSFLTLFGNSLEFGHAINRVGELGDPVLEQEQRRKAAKYFGGNFASFGR